MSVSIFEDLKADQIYRYSTNGGVSWNIGGTSRVTHRIFSKNTVGTGKRRKPFPLDQTPYSADIWSHRNPYGTIQSVNPWDGAIMQWIGPHNGGHPHYWVAHDVESQLINEALIDALKALKDQKFNAGVAMAEAGGLADMLHGAGKGFLNTRRKFLNGDFKDAYRMFTEQFRPPSWSQFKDQYGESLPRVERLRKVPSSWLYYHFGIKPTLDDMSNAYQEWVDRFNDNPAGMTGFVRGQAKYTQHHIGDTIFGSVDGHDVTLEIEQAVHVRLQVQMSNPLLARLSTLGATNVPEALWNRAPWTWAVDKFISFGDVLSVLDAGTGWSFGDTTTSFRTRHRAECKRFTYQGNPVALTPYRYRRIVLRRDVVGNIVPPTWRIVPKLKLKGPGIKAISNILSALALSFQGGRGR